MGYRIQNVAKYLLYVMFGLWNQVVWTVTICCYPIQNPNLEVTWDGFHMCVICASFNVLIRYGYLFIGNLFNNLAVIGIYRTAV